MYKYAYIFLIMIMMKIVIKVSMRRPYHHIALFCVCQQTHDHDDKNYCNNSMCFLVALMLLYFMESRPLDLWSKKGNKNNSIITVIILVTSYIALRRIALFFLYNTLYNYCKKKKKNTMPRLFFFCPSRKTYHH